MVNYTNENNRRDLASSGWSPVDFSHERLFRGTIFLLLGITWLASSNGKGLTLFRDKPDGMRILLKGTTIALLILAFVILVLNAIP
jgi:hypothetical protein